MKNPPKFPSRKWLNSKKGLLARLVGYLLVLATVYDRHRKLTWNGIPDLFVNNPLQATASLFQLAIALTFLFVEGNELFQSESSTSMYRDYVVKIFSSILEKFNGKMPQGCRATLYAVSTETDTNEQRTFYYALGRAGTIHKDLKNQWWFMQEDQLVLHKAYLATSPSKDQFRLDVTSSIRELMRRQGISEEMAWIKHWKRSGIRSVKLKHQRMKALFYFAIRVESSNPSNTCILLIESKRALSKDVRNDLYAHFSSGMKSEIESNIRLLPR